MFSEFQGPGKSLASAANLRLWQAFRPSTMTSYMRMFKDFLAFLHLVTTPVQHISVTTVLSFMEYLVQAGFSASNITNYVTALGSMCILLACNTAPFRDNRIQMFVKAITINRPLEPVLYLPIDEMLLSRIVEACGDLPHPLLLGLCICYVFFSFLRLSNILPHSLTTFDSSRHLCRADIVFSHQDAVIIVKWSKTLQNRRHIATVNIPHLNASPLCPVTALKLMMQVTSSQRDDPLFLYKKLGNWAILTDSVARKHLKDVSRVLALPKGLTFHDFRRGGATWAYNHGASIQDIQKQGTWSSQCVWRYIRTPPASTSAVSRLFSSHLAS